MIFYFQESSFCFHYRTKLLSRKMEKLLIDAMQDDSSWENPHFPTEVTHDHMAKRNGREEEVLEVPEEPKKKKKLKKGQKGKTVKVEEEEDKGKIWKDDEIEILIALCGEMDLEFMKNSKKQGTSYILTHSLLSMQSVLQCNLWVKPRCLSMK